MVACEEAVFHILLIVNFKVSSSKKHAGPLGEPLKSLKTSNFVEILENL